MECTFLGEDGSACGDPASSYMNIPLCDEHREVTKGRVDSRARTAALQASQHHPPSAFPGTCYVALLPDGKVKIGYSNSDELLRRRYQVLSREYKAPVIPLAELPGGFVTEAVLHDKFKDYRLPGAGERFTYSPEMAEYLSTVK